MTAATCARCQGPAVFIVAAGDPATFWYRCESTCLTCLAASRRWAGFVGPVTLTPVGDTGTPSQGTLFDLPTQGRR